MNAETIFADALKQDDPDRRAEFLDQACGHDAALRAEVDELLQAHDAADDFLNLDGAYAATVQPPPVSERAGDVIGPYKLLQQIGEGGFGVVYMAEQTAPVRRKVALKIIKPGMDTKEVIARFEAERQALALMDHPNIARVLDGGATQTGRPYFVMELVKGVPITQFCDENRLDTGRRLELFRLVCKAIQHAHQKGVIHRDIKPSNVMVTLHDGEPVPRIIDFGVAKAISQQLTERTMFTAYGQMIGTPQYMSPEQAEMSGLDVDTRSDVYSLGVLLYELLTGCTPLDPKELRRTAFHEMQRMIRETEPPRPSVRLTTLGEQTASIAASRSTDPRKLGDFVRGELDWIAMKALEKNRERRYETANALAADVERFLNDDPVEACPPSLLYRVRKFARRHRPVFATSAVVAVALVAGTSLALSQAVRATREALDAQKARSQMQLSLMRAEAAEAELRDSLAQTEEERRIAVKARQEALEQAAIALKNKESLDAVVAFLVREFFSIANPYRDQYRDLTVLEVVKTISSDPDIRFPEDPESEATLRHYLGVICHRAGLNDLAVTHLNRALELRTTVLGEDDIETARTRYALAYAMLDFRIRFRTRSEQQVVRERIFQHVSNTVPVMEEKLGPNDVETLHALALQIFLLSYFGDGEQIADLYQVLEQRLPENLPPMLVDDPLFLIDSVFVLAHLGGVGRDPEVDAEILKRYDWACRNLPEKNLRRVFWTEWYAGTLRDPAEKLALGRQTYAIREEVLGEENYFTFLSGRGLASVMVQLEMFDEAIGKLEEALVAVPEHAPQTLNLGILYLRRNQDGDRGQWLGNAEDMLEEYEYTDNAAMINYVLNLCLASPAQSDPERAMQRRALSMADRFKSLEIGDIHRDAWDTEPHRQMSLALAEYRRGCPSGDFERCRPYLDQLQQGDIRMFRAIGCAISAAIAGREGNREQADELIEQARREEAEAPVQELYTHQCFRWNRRFLLDFLIAEAEQSNAAQPVAPREVADPGVVDGTSDPNE